MAGAFYHVMARGNRRERIFRDEVGRLLFYQTLGEALAGWLEGACVGPDEQSLSSNGRNARSQRGGGNAMVAEDLYPAA
jgi:hypothetical protein